jgi:hypothetical protein
MRSLIIFFIALLASCTRIPGRAECEALVSHLVDLELKERPAADMTRDKVLNEMGATRLDHCLKNVSLERVQCGLRASSLKQAEDCDK